jgi:hypothetical protein
MGQNSEPEKYVIDSYTVLHIDYDYDFSDMTFGSFELDLDKNRG